MSLLGFERALADLAAKPDLCRLAIANAAEAFTAYELTRLERSRLERMVCDRLFATNCLLYRVNRITPLWVFFPLTCERLGPNLRQEVDLFWSSHPCADLQYLNETRRFVRFLRARMAEGLLAGEDIEATIAYEAANIERQFAFHEASVVRQ